MSTQPASQPSGDAPTPTGWKPYLLAFAVGAVILTVMPLVQTRFLKAPPPVLQLEPWQAGAVASTQLQGKVTLLTVEVGPCAQDCLERQQAFAALDPHLSDLGDGVVLVTLTDEAAAGAVQQLASKAAGSRWKLGSTDDALMTQLQKGLTQFLGAENREFARSHSLVLIDQNDAVRGYWQGDVVGRGNAVNAARLLAKKGPQP
ncbi:MAG: hypothetical protein U0228_21100 [Myxococcaceae bacterium]